MQNFINVSAAVLELSWDQRKKKAKNFATMLKTILSSLLQTVTTTTASAAETSEKWPARSHRYQRLFGFA